MSRTYVWITVAFAILSALTLYIFPYVVAVPMVLGMAVLLYHIWTDKW